MYHGAAKNGSWPESLSAPGLLGPPPAAVVVATVSPQGALLSE